MLVLIFTLILLIFMILLNQLNPGLLTINLLGLVIKNIPLSFFMLIFIVIGILWTSGIFGIKYFRLKKRYAELVASLQEKNTEE